MTEVFQSGKAAVVSVNMGRYDHVHRVPEDSRCYEWVYITDDQRTARSARRRGWHTLLVPKGPAGLLRSREPKACPSRYVNVPASVYLDARYRVDSEQVIQSLLSYVDGNRWLALFAHHDRETVEQEALECIRRGLGAEGLRDQLTLYQQSGRHGLKLWAAAVIVRRHGPEARAFGERWMSELRAWPTRDQVSLPVVLHDLDIRPETIPGTMHSFPGLNALDHRRLRAGERPAELVRRRVKAIRRRYLPS